MCRAVAESQIRNGFAIVRYAFSYFLHSVSPLDTVLILFPP